jgi:hypothetical protein
MRKVATSVVVLLATMVSAGAALAAAPPPKQYPSDTVKEVFVAAQTVAADGSAHNIFAPGDTVVFRAYGVDIATKKALVAQSVRYFYAEIPGVTSVKLKYGPTAPGATKRFAWTGTWTVPADYPLGLVKFRVLVQEKNRKRGQFVQFPVAPAQLTIAKVPPADPTGPVPATADSADQALSLYVDAVAGTRAAPGVAKRPVGCTQANVYKRGEDVVFRAWGVDLTTGQTLSTDNIDSATVTLPGLAAPLKLNYGAHGATNSKVFFWSLGWIVPKDYPLGNAVAKITFTTDEGKTGSFDFALTLIP